MFNYLGKTVVVTGSSRGIGRDIAQRFYDAGANLAMCSRSPDSIKRAIDEISKGDSKRIYGISTDTSNVDQLHNFLNLTLEKYSHIDILINNAGVQFPQPTIDLNEKQYNEILDTNLKGYFFAAQYCARHMISQGIAGNIVNIGSVHGSIVQVGMAPYAISKAGINQLTKSLAREWGKYGIRVNCVAPGSIPTDINKEIYADPAVQKAMCDKLPLGRRGTKKEVSDAVLFFASEYASYITGQTLYVDGGLTLVG